MRLGELAQLKISDVNFETVPTTIRIRKETTKTRETRFTCISTEATRLLKDYLYRNYEWDEKSEFDNHIFLINPDDDYISKKYFKSVLSAKATLANMLTHVIQSIPQLNVKNENG